jgi:hypothetical protein
MSLCSSTSYHRASCYPFTSLQQRNCALLQDCLASSMCQGQAPPRRQPTASPPFTIGTLRKAIPPHCFDRSLLRSSAYLGADLAAVAVLYLCTTLFSHPSVPALVRWGVLWPAYWVLQGAVCTGLWVIAHECGHQVVLDTSQLLRSALESICWQDLTPAAETYAFLHARRSRSI